VRGAEGPSRVGTRRADRSRGGRSPRTPATKPRRTRGPALENRGRAATDRCRDAEGYGRRQRSRSAGADGRSRIAAAPRGPKPRETNLRPAVTNPRRSRGPALTNRGRAARTEAATGEDQGTGNEAAAESRTGARESWPRRPDRSREREGYGRRQRSRRSGADGRSRIVDAPPGPKPRRARLRPQCRRQGRGRALVNRGRAARTEAATD
jgi:hypothetical protein